MLEPMWLISKLEYNLVFQEYGREKILHKLVFLTICILRKCLKFYEVTVSLDIQELKIVQQGIHFIYQIFFTNFKMPSNMFPWIYILKFQICVRQSREKIMQWFE